MTAWAKENVVSSGLQDKPVRFIVDDVLKFVNREIRRGNKYDAIIMDPLSYTTGISSTVLQNILRITVDKNYQGKLECGEIGLPMEESNLILPCGIYGRWEI